MTRGGLGEAARIAAAAPRLWGLALAGFLARGGIVLFALPILVVPSVVGIVTFIGPDAVTAAGLSSRFTTLIVLTVAIVGAWLAVGLVVGVFVDLALIDAVVPRSGTDRRPMVGRLLAIRAVSFIPLAVGLAIAGARLLDVGYQEMILPTDTGAPLVTRVLRGAPDAIAAVALGWLVGEIVGAVATRLAVIDGRSVGRSLAGSLGWVVRRPIRTTWIAAATLSGSVIVIGLALAAASAAWGFVRETLLGSPQPAAAVVTVSAFVAIWVGGLVLAGLVAAWRSVAWSLAVAGDHRGAGARRSDGGTL